ncbi:DUF4856 domain-containing protein [Aliiroseovarius sp.]|uniref:DUF4856 domain-containing protein n=1 Tax=Aliiroseovarius sp. TaxID=1872442 RepID=UPI003BAAA858
MFKSALKTGTCLAALVLGVSAAQAEVYGPFPVTVKGYEGDKTNSVSYSGQIARHVLHDSLKSLAGKGDGGMNAADLETQMLAYFMGNNAELPILAPADKDGIDVKQATMGDISASANLEGKFYNGAMSAWPGNMTGKEVIRHMIAQAAKSNGGFDPETGYNWPQLISKFTMGAVSYHQAVDNYLDEKMEAGNKPNGAPYKEGAYYTGKEHSWDEAFGYWGAAAHSLELSAGDNYTVAKLRDLGLADANGDGMVDLKSEMVFGPAYYAAGADKGGASEYLPTMFNAFLEGRKLIAAAGGENLSAEDLATLQGHAAVIADTWEKVLAEAAFKYAGSVYKDITAIQEAADDEARAKAYANYGKHWGELKGFAMALQTGKNNLGETAVMLNELIGFGPVTLNNSYVTGIDAEGNFIMDRRMSWNDYQLNMLKTQTLLADTFGLLAKANDQMADLGKLTEMLDAETNAETD